MNVYCHRINPEDYMEYEKRCAKAITRKQLDNSVQFTVLRHLDRDADNNIRFYKESLDYYTKRFNLGKMVWPQLSVLFSRNVKDFIDEIAKRGLYLYDIWGYLPGAIACDAGWGQLIPDEAVYRYIQDKLGEKFIGLDNGEQDGRYVGTYALQMCPSSMNRKRQYINFQKHFEKMGNHLYDNLVAFCSLYFCHYFAKEGNTIFLQAESAQALPNVNLWYAFLRGAGKQYGLLWGGNVSVFNRWGFKNHYSEKRSMNKYVSDDGGPWGPDCGTSMDLMKKINYVQYMYNCDIMGFEMGWLYTGETIENPGKDEAVYVVNEKTVDKRVELTPIGKLQEDTVKLAAEYGYPGVMHTPAAILIDFFQGWVPPRHLYSGRTYSVWGNLPYGRSDHQLHALFDLIYPGYENSGFFRDERGFLAPTPFGDIFDILLSDAKGEVLQMYNIVLVAGDVRIDLELTEKLKKYVKGGGTVITTVSNIGTIYDDGFFGIKGISGYKKAGNPSVIYNGIEYPEDEMRIADVMTAGNAHAIAEERISKAPVIIENTYGRGKVYVITVPYGLTDRQKAAGHIKNDEEKSIPAAYELALSVKAFLGEMFRSQNLFDIDGTGIQYITNIGGNREDLFLTIVNNENADTVCSIRYRYGKIQSAYDILTGKQVTGEQMMQGCKTDGETWNVQLKPEDIRIFKIKTAESRLNFKEKVLFEKGYEKLSIKVFTDMDIKNQLLFNPALSYKYPCITTDASAIINTDEEKIVKLAGYLRKSGVTIQAVDFSSMINNYPDIDLGTGMEDLDAKQTEMADGCLKKASLLAVPHAIFSVNRRMDFTVDEKEFIMGIKERLRKISGLGEKYGIEILITAAPNKHCRTSDEAAALVKDLNCRNVSIALSTSHCLLLEENLVEVYGKYSEMIKCILVSAPFEDDFNQMYDVHIPVHSSKYRNDVGEFLTKVFGNGYNGIICVDSHILADNDELYREYEFIDNCFKNGRR